MTTERRLKGLISAVEEFITEAKNVHSLASKYKLYKIIHENIVNIKLLMYALVVLLNVNCLMSDEVRNTRSDSMNSLTRMKPHLTAPEQAVEDGVQRQCAVRVEGKSHRHHGPRIYQLPRLLPHRGILGCVHVRSHAAAWPNDGMVVTCFRDNRDPSDHHAHSKLCKGLSSGSYHV